MARTLTEIRAALDAAKAAESALSGLTSTSATAIWRLILDVVALAIFAHEAIMTIFLAEVEAAEAKAYVGTATWYRDKALDFQYGDALSISPPFEYAVVNEAIQIVKRAVAVEESGAVSVKVAKLDALNVPIPLSAPELSAFQFYMGQIKVAGITLAIISTNADTLAIIGDIFVDPSIIAPDGSLVSDPSTFPVNGALDAYLASLPYDGRIWNAAVNDAIQGVAGVVYPGALSIQAAEFGGLLTEFDDFYVPFAGYATLSGSLAITYLPAP